MPDFAMSATQHTKLFKHEGPRTEETDSAAYELARHAMTEAFPGIGKIEFVWVHHNIPDVWLLFATGYTIREETS